MYLADRRHYNVRDATASHRDGSAEAADGMLAGDHVHRDFAGLGLTLSPRFCATRREC